jgi:hypothetical protein
MSKQTPSGDAEYTRLTTHLDYLDDKIFKFLSLYAQIAVAIIGGAFFLSTTNQVHASWAFLSNCLMVFISLAFGFFIIQHLLAWKRYRVVLSDRFETGEPGQYWYMSEVTQVLFIGFICIGFLIFNPMNNRAQDQFLNSAILISIGIVIFLILRAFQKKSFKPSLAYLLVLLILVLPLQVQIKECGTILKDRLKNGDISLTYKGAVIKITTPASPSEIGKAKLSAEQIAPFEFPKRNETRHSLNLITNGSFDFPLTDPVSGWGVGLYSSQIQRLIPNAKIAWINFLNADIDTQIISTDKGNALEIINRTGDVPNRVGIMEQVITVSPGLYELSFWAKGEALEPSALWIATTSDWRMTDEDKTRRGLDLKESGSFDWKQITETIKVDENGPITLTLVSKGKGRLYLSGLVFRQAN